MYFSVYYYRSSDPDLHLLPRKWLSEVLVDIKSNDPESRLCATRRSAGVPFYVQVFIVAKQFDIWWGIQICPCPSACSSENFVMAQSIKHRKVRASVSYGYIFSYCMDNKQLKFSILLNLLQCSSGKIFFKKRVILIL